MKLSLTIVLASIIFLSAFSFSYAEDNPIVSALGKDAEGAFTDYLYRFIGANESKPFTPEDSDSPLKISGSYRMNAGYQWAGTNDFLWKSADAEMNGYNFRYLWGENRYNTFNPNVYNSFELTMDLEPDTNWGVHMDLVVDPWAFVGETERISVTGNWGNTISLQLPYWSNTGRTRAVAMMTPTGDTLDIPAIQVDNGRTKTALGVTSGWGEVFNIPAMDVEREFRPIKNLWFDYDTDMFETRAFVYADQAHGMKSDDPLGLSGHHIYWEPSPWISFWEPGVLYSATGWAQGSWTADSAEGRQGERLRQLRGVSLKGFLGPADIEAMVASSISPWNDYEKFNNVAFAGRIKSGITESVTIGSTYTGRVGMKDWYLESFEQAYGIDGSIFLSPDLEVEAEFAQSYSGLDIDKALDTVSRGTAATARVNYKKSFDEGETSYRFALTHMSDAFDPPLATYTSTRDNQSWSDHIEFKERPDADMKIKIGDGIDRGRNTFSVSNETGLFEGRFNFLTDYRLSHETGSDKFSQEVIRNESTIGFSDSITGKTLVVSRNRHPGENREHTWIFGGGLECELNEQITLQGVFERANEYPWWPQAAATWLTVDPDPPSFFNMYKFKVIFEPYKDLEFEYSHCRNGFKYATGQDDNINYDGVEIRWMPVEKLSTRVVYRHSSVVDLNEQIATGNVNFRPHDNIYAELNWEIWEDKSLSVRFGDLGEFVTEIETDPDSYTERTSIQPDVLDTQNIIRIAFTGLF